VRLPHRHLHPHLPRLRLRIPASAPSGAAVDCQGIGTTTSAITTAVHDVGALVGTATDPASVLADLPALQVTIASLVPMCVPDAVDDMWSLDAALLRLREQFQRGRERTAIAADRALLLNTRIAGNALFDKLGLDPSVWQDIPRKARLTCGYLATLGPGLTTAVTELSRLVGSSADRAPYFVMTISGHSTAITDLAPACEPKSQAAAADLTSAVEKLTTEFKPGTDPSVLAADKAALNEVRANGTTLYRVLGLNAVGWENVPSMAQ
jgi:hypothetical protein